MTLWKEEEMVATKSANAEVLGLGPGVLDDPLFNLDNGGHTEVLALLGDIGMTKVADLVSLSHGRLERLLRSGDLRHHSVNFNENDHDKIDSAMRDILQCLAAQPDSRVCLRPELQTLAEAASYWRADEPEDLPAPFVTLVLNDSYTYKLTTLRTFWKFQGSIADLVRRIRIVYSNKTGFPGLRVEVQRQIMAKFHYIS